MATIKVFEVGHCTHLACLAARGDGWKKRTFPARSYLIETEAGRWLWDTGYATHFQEHTRTGVMSLYRRATPVHFDAEQSAVRQLARHGYVPEDLTGVVISHFHGDHIAGLKDFPQVPLLCSITGWESLRSLRGLSALLRGFVPALMPADFERRAQWIERCPRVRLPDDLWPFQFGFVLPGGNAEILVVELPGHAVGHIGAFVLTASGWELLAGDAAWTQANYRELRAPSLLTYGLLHDRAAYFQTLMKLHELDKRGRVAIHLAHELGHQDGGYVV
ncbi:MBL fold metallo-hydrolase [Stenotrophomonas sp. LM091]|uniref:MBL fold metallo-hydrolase n=1 Tax=Stenotrophomonas sp. LM091 TaxID=1904944 RepID=UPI0009F328EE|nr:MBL fold metallo-hydrolase [Stenotrophomonas sp. LM091]